MSEDRAAALPLVVEGVVKAFGRVTVLSDVSLVLEPGDALGITGAHGCGMTVLIDIISGFLAPDRGRVRAGGYDLAGRAPHRVARAGIARTFQRPNLAFDMTVEENVRAAVLCRRRHARAAEEYPSRPAPLPPCPPARTGRSGATGGDRGGARFGGHRQAVERALALTGLHEFRREEAHRLSPGQIRGVEVARALAGSPNVLLLDEPFAALGEEDAPEMLSTIRRLRAEGMTMLVTAHRRPILDVLCTRVVSLEAGRLPPLVGSIAWNASAGRAHDGRVRDA